MKQKQTNKKGNGDCSWDIQIYDIVAERKLSDALLVTD
jgi:hypothetical protein